MAPMPRSWPESMKPFDDGNWSKIMFTVPDITSCMPGPEPLYGTWMSLVPEYAWNDSPSMWLMLPTPELAYEYLPGLAFSTAMSSFRSFAGNDGVMLTTLGIEAMLVIGMKLSNEYCGRACTAGYTIIVLTVAMTSV